METQTQQKMMHKIRFFFRGNSVLKAEWVKTAADGANASLSLTSFTPMQKTSHSNFYGYIPYICIFSLICICVRTKKLYNGKKNNRAKLVFT